MFSVIRFRLTVLILVVLLSLSSTQLLTAQDPTPEEPLMSFNVSYGGSSYDAAANQTTFTYIVSGTGARPDLSHFDVGIPSCAPPLIIVGTSPTEAVRFGVDPTTGVDGIKWDLPLKTTETRTYSITFEGQVTEGTVSVAVKGDAFQVGSIPGPSCAVASINVDKFFSTDSISWQDAGDAPGPELETGVSVWFRFVVTNIGNAELSNLALSDSVYDTTSCTKPEKLAPGASFECTIGPFTAANGQHSNTATASGSVDGMTVTDTDHAYYYSGDLAAVQVAKFVSPDGGTTWTGLAEVEPGDSVSFKFVVSNTGNVPLSGFSLSDSAFDTSTCVLPAELAPGTAFECTIGPIPAGPAEHTNTVTATATFEDQTVSATDTASYRPADEDDGSDVIIVIEGPVDNINVNIITIFGMDVEIDVNDPVLAGLEIGDTVRVEGDMTGTGNTIVIVAVTVVVINIDIVVFQPGTPPSVPIVVPANCKITGIGNNNPHLKCSNKGSKKSSKKS